MTKSIWVWFRAAGGDQGRRVRSRFWMYFPVPLAGVAMIVFELECIYEEIRGICLKEEV